MNNNGYNNQNNSYNNNNGYNAPPNRSMPNNNSNYNNHGSNYYNNDLNSQNNIYPNMTFREPPPLGPVNGQNTVQSSLQSTQQPQRYTPTAAPTSNLPKPKRRRPPNTDYSTPLIKGQKIPVGGSGRIKIGVGWDVNDDRCELDASAFMLGKNNKVVGDEWFVFYGQDTSPDNSVKYKVFDIGMVSQDDAELSIDLNKVDPSVEKIVIAITIYEAAQNRLHFGMVSNVFARLIDADTNKETARFVQDECYNNVTALVLGELYRYKGFWKFNAVGSGVARDLADFCAMYGVVMI